MARRKKVEDETVDQSSDRRVKEDISNNANRSEKTSWHRKMDNMVRLLAKLHPIEEQIIALEGKKLPIFDEIQELRALMIQECIHPFEYIVVEPGYAKCKFCERKLSLPRVSSFEEE